MKQALKRTLDKAGLLEFARRPSWHCKRRFGHHDRRIIKDYFDSHQQRGLHIGCSNYLMPGWLNTDYFPARKDVPHLDATKAFPLPAGSFDCVFSEHMIEHVPFEGGSTMLRDCRKILKPGGVARISTPDLQFLIDLRAERKSPLQVEYIKAYSPPCDPSKGGDTFVFNEFVRAWGHLFIYDEKTLRFSMERAGFKNVRRCAINESSVPALRNLEHEERCSPGFLRLETMTFEGET